MNKNSLIKSIGKKEWYLVGLIALATIIVTTIPYVYGYFTTPQGSVYSGIHHLSPGDTNVFMSMVEQVKQGENVFLNLYTAEPQHRILVNPLWLAVGWLGKILHLSNLLVVHVARILLILIFIFVLYLFIAYFFQENKKRKWILLLILFSSGLGVFFNPFLFDVNNIIEHPTDIWVTESITFLTLYHSPHILASLILIVTIFLLMLLAFDRDKIRYSLGAGVACLFLLWFHPFNGPTIYLVLATYLLIFFLWQRKIIWSYVRHYLILAMVPIPVVLYLFSISQIDWVIRNWAAQNILPSPSVWMYVIGYGFILLLAIVGLWITLKKPQNKGIFLISWIICSSMLIYLPLLFQRRMSEGLHIPLTIMAGFAIFYFLDLIKKKYGQASITIFALIISLVIFLPLTNIQILGQDLYLYQTKKTLPYYLYEEEVEAMLWLKNNLGQDEIIFSSYYMGNYIPAYSGRIVWIGHGPQTINLNSKKVMNDWFWQSDLEQNVKYEFLKDNNIDYVFYSRKAKEIGSYNPDTKSYLKEVFRNAQTKIYKVR